MAAEPLATTAIVLDRTTGGENWLRLRCLSAGQGHLNCLQRLARRAAPTAPPLDLFDEAHLVLESRNQGRTWFVREAVPLRRRTALASSYAALEHACRLARVLARHLMPEDSRAAVVALFTRALDAWEAGGQPAAVYFKSLYLLARDEGYPVREDWWQSLRADDRAVVELVLRQPAGEQTTAPAEIARLVAALELYLLHNTELQVGD